MFNRFSNTSSLSTPTVSNNSFFGSQAQPQTNSIPQSTSPFTPFGASAAAGAGTSPSSISSLGAPSIPYAITNEIENGITVKLLSITAMPAYRHLSQDEIRVDDYSKGRKGPSSFPGSQPGAFSQPFSSSATSGAGGFPYSSSSTAPGGFSGFGSNATTTTPASTGFGSFTPATTTSTTAPSSGFGGFGSGAFGSSNTSGFGTSSGTGTDAFGSSNTSNTRGFGSFGATQPSTTTTPSSTVTGFGGFGSSSNIGTNAFAPSTPGMFGGFGQTQPQPQMSQSQQPFGQPTSTTSTMFGAKPSTSIFGSTPAPTPAFGSSAPFSAAQPSTPQAQQSTGFGQVQQPQSQQSTFGSSASTGMFGSTTGGGIFGTSSSTPASSTPFTNTSSGMFGQTTQQQPSIFGTTAATSTSNLFRPTTTTAPSTFGSTSTTPSTMFGASSGLANTSTVPGTGTGMAGMFNRPSTLGGTSTATNTTAFGSSALPSTGSAGFSFQPLGTTTGYSAGLSTQSQSQSQGQTTSLYQPAALPLVEPAPAGSLSLFPPLPPIFTKPAATATATATATTSSTEAPQQHPVKFTPRTSFRIKPRESYNLTTPIPINFGTGPLSSTTTTVTATNAATTLVPRKMMNGSIPNIKKLVVPDFNNINDQPSTPGTKDKESKESYTPYTSNFTPYTSSTTYPSISTPSNSILTDSMQFGQQYTFPPLKILKTTDRRSIKNFVIGQKGVGEVRFLAPVDLSEIDPDQLFGHYIEFSDCEAVMYPDPSIPKPEPGHGLNLPAQVRLERVWTMSKGSRDPIVDPQSEKVIHFIQKLKETEGTNFISYEPSTGTWTFTVDNF